MMKELFLTLLFFSFFVEKTDEKVKIKTIQKSDVFMLPFQVKNLLVMTLSADSYFYIWKAYNVNIFIVVTAALTVCNVRYKSS